MLRDICCSKMASFIAILALLLSSPLPAIARPRSFDPQEQKEGEKKKDSKKDEKSAKQEREYQKIKEFGQKLYKEDPGFRAEVEESYRQLQREHSEYAYLINTRD